MRGTTTEKQEPSDVSDAVQFIRQHLSRTPDVAIILGSGLGAAIDATEEAAAFTTAEIPGYPQSTVEGHQGRLVFGRVAGRDVVFVQGRVHLYEGHPVGLTAFPVRLAHALGARSVVLTNAAGGINPAFAPGTLMFITDHLTFSFSAPATGRGSPLRPQGPRMHMAYDSSWIARVEETAIRMGIRTRQGVYLWAAGPCYESKAEIKAFRRFGADAVGMSTVPEAMQAQALGMPVLGISAITNAAAGLSPSPLSHEEVLIAGRRMHHALGRILGAAVRQAPS